ncbi:predicted protein [Nematostella vectensis]|uniref:Apple domain-containing protein n=1 Tax=Nematostella vectensis TaxID=45351 RepID=A7SC13_NEMVE|nr:predicted protein [Nematostella vectensis]|eukprot:XP_001630790.1 predicted protein [Nematostella vectensis]
MRWSKALFVFTATYACIWFLANGICRSMQFLDCVEDKYLNGSSIRKFTSSTPNVCEINCFNEIACLSYNIGPIDLSGNRECELNFAETSSGSRLETREGFEYCQALVLITLNDLKNQVATQGRANHNQWVKEFEFVYRRTLNEQWSEYIEDGIVKQSPYKAIISQVSKENLKTSKFIMSKKPNAKGCSRSIKDILSYSSDVIGNAGGNVITLRFSGDGRKTTKKLGSVMTTFCFPAENSVKRSPEREYCISIYDGKESYDILKATLRGVFDEMKALGRTGILVNGLEYTIDWGGGCDHSFDNIASKSPKSPFYRELEGKGSESSLALRMGACHVSIIYSFVTQSQYRHQLELIRLCLWLYVKQSPYKAIISQVSKENLKTSKFIMSKKPWPMDRAKVVRMWIEGKTSCNFGGDTADDFQNTLKSGVVLCKTRSRVESYFAKHAQERSSTLQVSVTTYMRVRTRSRAESYFAKHAQERSSTLQVSVTTIYMRVRTRSRAESYFAKHVQERSRTLQVSVTTICVSEHAQERSRTLQNTLKSGVVLCKTRSRAESYFASVTTIYMRVRTRSRAESYFAKHAQERSRTLQASVTTIYMRVKTRSRAESYFAKHAQERSSTLQVSLPYICVSEHAQERSRTLQNTLKSGVVLCKLANAIQPGAIKKINNAKMNFMMMENIENFCNFVQTKGVASQYQFVTIDLFEGKNMHQVLITLNDLKNQTEKL